MNWGYPLRTKMENKFLRKTDSMQRKFLISKKNSMKNILRKFKRNK